MLSAKDYITVTSLISAKEDLTPAIERVNKDVILLADYDGVEEVQTVKDLNDVNWIADINKDHGGVIYMAAWGDYVMGSIRVPSLYFCYVNYEKWSVYPFDRWYDNLSDYAYAVACGDQVFNEDQILDIWNKSVLDYIVNCEMDFNRLDQKDDEIYPNPILSPIWRDLKDQIKSDMHKLKMDFDMRQRYELLVSTWRYMIESDEINR